MEQINYDELLEQNFLSSYTKEKPDEFMFILNTTFCAYNSPRRDSIYTPSYEGINDEFVKIKPINIIKKISSFTCDRDILNEYSRDYICFLIFSLYSTPFRLKQITLFSETFLNKPLLASASASASVSASASASASVRDINITDKYFNQYSITNSPDIEDEFDRRKRRIGKTCYLYHGSPPENWYSIMKNGLKTMSNTKNQINGAVYGEGIYLSDDILFSCNYTSSTSTSKILAVFEVVGDKDIYKKANNIYVVKDNKDLILRYIITYSNMSIFTLNNNAKKINEYFHKDIYVNKENSVMKYKEINNRRLMNDIRLLNKSRADIDKLGITIEFCEDDMFLWNTYFQFKIDSELENERILANDMEKYGIENVHMEIMFPPSYPHEPPFVRIVKPRFQHLTGHITIGGSICTELLTNTGWSPALSIENLLVTLKCNITEGNGRIDPQKYNIPYSLDEAKEAFNRVARRYGWLR